MPENIPKYFLMKNETQYVIGKKYRRKIEFFEGDLTHQG